MTDLQHENTVARLNTLQDTYRKIVSGESDIYLSVDPDLVNNIDEIKTLSKPVSQYSLQELQTLWKVVSAVEASITNANNLLVRGKYVHVSEIGEALISETLKKRRSRKNTA